MDTMVETVSAPADVQPAGHRGSSVRVGVIAAPVALFVVLMALWPFVASRNASLLPTPGEVWSDGFTNPEVRGRLASALWQTVKESFAGLAIAALLGIALAALMDRAQWVERALFPWAVALQTVPILALVPLIKARYGVGFTPRAIVCVLIAIFPIMTNTLFGLKSTDSDHHDLFTLHRAGRTRRLFRLQFPGALPSIFTGLRISAGLSVVGAIIGEYFFRSGETGIGHLIETYRAGRHDYDDAALFATVTTACLLGIVVFGVFGYASNVATRSWYEPASTPE
jgi:NitT/TauT family transport system permease protein